MSWFTNFEGFFTQAESAVATVVTDAAPVVPIVKEAASVAATLVPSIAPEINMAEAAANSVAAIAPTAIGDVAAVIAQGRQAVTDIGPAFKSLEAAFEAMWTPTPAPGGAVLLTPKTSSANAPATSLVAPPGTAKS